MSRLLRAALALVLLAVLAPMTALGARDASDVPSQATPILDTPEPTPRRTPRPTRTPRPDPTRQPDRTVAPEVTPAPDAQPVILLPDRNAITIGYREPGVMGQAPLLVALLAGYFTAAGFEDVRIVEVPDTLADIRAGELDFAVVEAAAAGAATAEDATLRAVAGFQNYAADGSYDPDLLLAAPGLVADEPATVIAFLIAYLRALRDLSDEDSAAEALGLIDATDLSLDPELAASWADAVGVFAPFDGGFGDLADEGGLVELALHLEAADARPTDLSYFIAQHTLNIAQLSQGLESNPANSLIGPPGLTEISVGLSGGDAVGGPVIAAIAAGHFDAMGFDSVAVMDIEEPLLGVLNGELDFAVVSTVEAADGASQGLPLRLLAGHRNVPPEGTGDADVLVVSTDVLEQEPATVGAFLIVYVRAARDLRDSEAAEPWAPHDGGYGDRALDGGMAELLAHLEGALGDAPDIRALMAAAPLELAQAWWGLPANPVRSPLDDSDISASDTTGGDAAAGDATAEEEAG
ncbi:hypothetical protein BH24CHL9_BH24CHL9_00540 [soil metagenome]